MALAIHGAHRKNHIVFRYGKRDARDVAHGSSMFPFGAGCGTPERFVTCGSRTGRRLPSERGIIFQFRGKEADLGWRSGRRSKGCEGGRIQAGNIGQVVEVDELRKVAEFNSALRAHVLMLVVVVFAKFGEAHRGESLLVERTVIAPAQITVKAKHQHWLDP